MSEHLQNSRQLIATLITEDMEWDYLIDAGRWLHVKHPERSYQTCKRIAKFCWKKGMIRKSRRLEESIIALWAMTKKVECPLLQMSELKPLRSGKGVINYGPGIFTYTINTHE